MRDYWFGQHSYPSEPVEDGWINVVSRRKAREERQSKNYENNMNICKGRPFQNHSKVSTFFFTEFPEDLIAKDMFEIFADYGKVLEVIIPAKRDKRRRKFGFVRFLDVRDERSTVTHLDNIFIGKRKLFANVPRFQRGHEKTLPFENQPARSFKPMHSACFHEKKVLATHEARKNIIAPRTNPPKERLSCAQALQNQRPKIVKKEDIVHKLRWRKVQTEPKTSKFAHLHFKVEDKEIERFKKSFIGKVLNSGTTYNIQDIFHTQDIL